MKLFLTVTCLLLIYPAVDGLAQKPSKKIEVGVGVGTIPQFRSIFTDIVTGIFSGGIETDARGTGGISAGYYSGISGRAYVGATYVFEYQKKEFYRNSTQVGKGNVISNSLMGSFDFYWIDRQKFGMFSGAGFGFSFYRDKQQNSQSGETDTYSKEYVAFQVDLLGFEFGQRFNVTTAFGLGQEGIIALRLGHRF